MALEDALLQQIAPPTLPIDFASTVLSQPIQPQMDETTFADSLDQAHYQANLPNFFREVAQSFADHQQALDEQQQQYDAAQADAQNQAQDEQAQQPQELQVIGESPAPSQVEQQPQPTPAPTPETTPGAGIVADQPSQGGLGLGALAPAETNATAQDLGLLPSLSDEQKQAATGQVPEGYHPTPTVTPREDLLNPSEQEKQRLREGFQTDQGNNPLPVVGEALNTILQPISEAGRKVAETGSRALSAAENAPVIGSLVTPPGQLGSMTEEQKAKQAGEVGAFAAPAVADILTGGALTPLFGTQAADQAAQVGIAYHNGDMSGKEALLALAKLSPMLLPVVAHGVGALSDFARAHPEAVADVQTKLGGLQGETGAIKLPGALEETAATAPTTKYYHGTGTPEEAQNILQNGFRPGEDIHVTTEPDLARQFALRKSDNPSVVEVNVTNPDALGGQAALRTGQAENLQPTRVLSPEEVQTSQHVQAGQPPPGGTTPPTTTGTTPPVAKPAPAPEVNETPWWQRAMRTAARQAGGEATARPIVDAAKAASRTENALHQEANALDVPLHQKLDAANADPTVVKSTANAPSVHDAVAKAQAAGDEAMLARMRYTNPNQFDLTPAQVELNNSIKSTLDATDLREKQLGIPSAHQTSQPISPVHGTDEQYFPYQVQEHEGAPIGSLSRYTRGRAAGNIFDKYLNGQEFSADPVVDLRAHLEARGTRASNFQLLRDMQGMSDEKGPYTKYAVPGSSGTDNYTPVRGFSDLNENKIGAQTLVRKDAPADFLRDRFENQLPGFFKPFAGAAQQIRAFTFGLTGPLFHGLNYENMAAALQTPHAAAETIGKSLATTLNPDHIGEYLATPEGGALARFRAKTGGQAELGKAATPELRAGKGAIERQPSIAAKIPGVGKYFNWSQDVIFDRIVPTVQHHIWSTLVNDWSLKHPDLVPQGWDDAVQAGASTEQLMSLAKSSPEFLKASEDANTRANHVTGFTENTLGRGEKQLSSMMLSTPTITRAIAGNMRDMFSAPGTLRGDQARKFWLNSMVAAGGSAYIGTLLAKGPDAEELDPTSSKFVFNPGGSNFLYIALPNGGRLSVVPSPIRTPIKTLLTSGALPVKRAIAGDTLQHIIAGDETLSDFKHVAGGFTDPYSMMIQNRISGPARLGQEFIQNVKGGMGYGEAAKEAGVTAAGSDVPIPAQAAAQAVIKGQAPDLAALGKGALSSTGAAYLPPTAFAQYDDYLKSVKNPDGSQRFPDGTATIPTTANNFNQFTETDPQAQQLKAQYEQHRADTGTPLSKETLSLEQERQQRISAEDQKLAQTGNLVDYRHAITNIRADIAQRMSRLAFSDPTTPTTDKALLGSWYQTFDQAKDPVSGAIDPNKLEENQATWKTQHPGEYERLVQPAYEGGGLSDNERQLRTDRDKINAYGWWNVPQQAWSFLQGRAVANLGLNNFATYQDYKTAKMQQIAANAARSRVTPANIPAYSQYVYTQDPVAKAYSKIQANDHLKLEARNPELIQLLSKWGYSSTSKKELQALAAGTGLRD